jgi:hypothetical protein
MPNTQLEEWTASQLDELVSMLGGLPPGDISLTSKERRLFRHLVMQMPQYTPEAGRDDVVATMLVSDEETIFTKGWAPNVLGFTSIPLTYSSPSP